MEKVFYKNPNPTKPCEFSVDEKTGDYHGCFINKEGNWVLCEEHFKLAIYELTGKKWEEILDD